MEGQARTAVAVYRHPTPLCILPSHCSYTSPHFRTRHLNDRPDFFIHVCSRVDQLLSHNLEAERPLKAMNNKKSVVSGESPVDWPLCLTQYIPLAVEEVICIENARVET